MSFSGASKFAEKGAAMLIRYELKKIFSKRANQAILLLLAVLMIHTCASALRQVEWVDEQGNWITGHAAAVKLQEAGEGWSGKLDQQLLEKTVAELKRRYNSIEIDDHSQESNWLLRYQLQGVQEIGDLLCLSFANDYSTFEEMIENLSPQELSRFYENRVEDRRAWLYGDDTSWGYYNYSEAEKKYILSRTEAMPTPMEIGYHEGWAQATGQLPTLLKYGLVLLSFVLAGVFSDEFTWKTDAVYYNSFHGRTKATAIKVGLGFAIILVFYWLCVGIYSLIVFGSLGSGGAEHILQSHPDNWSTWENMTFRQMYLLSIGAGCLGYLFIGFLVLWISAKTKSPVLAVLIPPLLLLLPGFLHEFYSPTMRRVIGILPDKLLDIGEAIRYLYLYTIGDRIMNAVPIVVTVYPCLTILLISLCYREYRRKQIA